MKVVNLFLILSLVVVTLLMFGCLEQPVCGNGICEIGETPENCNVENGGDCPSLAEHHTICENGLCVKIVGKGENECINDTECAFEDECGNGICDFGETEQTCFADCFQENSCPETHVDFEGECFPKIINAVEDYENAEELIHYYEPQEINDKEKVNFNYLPLVEKTNELIEGTTDDFEKIRNISNWVLNSKPYGLSCVEEHESVNIIEENWENCSGVCREAAQTTVAMFNIAGIPSLLHPIVDAAHITTLYNQEGVWGVIDTTYFKGAFDQEDQEINFNQTVYTEPFKENLFYFFVDKQGQVFNENQKMYCDLREENCSSTPFVVRKMLISPEIATTSVFIPATSIINNYEYVCSFEVSHVNCFGYGCIFNEETPTLDDFPIEKYLTPDDSIIIRSDKPYTVDDWWITRYLKDTDSVSKKPGYVYLEMPKNINLTYTYQCIKNNQVVAEQNGGFMGNEKIIINWNSLSKPVSASAEDYDAVVSALKEMTDDLEIFP